MLVHQAPTWIGASEGILCIEQCCKNPTTCTALASDRATAPSLNRTFEEIDNMRRHRTHASLAVATILAAASGCRNGG